MGRQRNKPQTEEQENSREKLNEMEASNLSDREFRIMIIRILHVMIMRILNSIKKDIVTIKRQVRGENQDGGVGRHTAPPGTTRTDRKSNDKEV